MYMEIQTCCRMMRLFIIIPRCAGLTLSTPGDLAISLGTSDTARALVSFLLEIFFLENRLCVLSHLKYRCLGLPKNINPVLKAMCFLIPLIPRVTW